MKAMRVEDGVILSVVDLPDVFPVRVGRDDDGQPIFQDRPAEVADWLGDAYVAAPADAQEGMTWNGSEVGPRPPSSPGVPLAELKEFLKRSIDDVAERQRLRWITPGAGQAMTYARKVDQAKAVLATVDPQPADFPMLASSIGIDGADLVSVANVILAMDAAWETIGAAIEAARLGAKHAIDLATTVADVEAVAADWPDPPG